MDKTVETALKEIERRSWTWGPEQWAQLAAYAADQAGCTTSESQTIGEELTAALDRQRRESDERICPPWQPSGGWP